MIENTFKKIADIVMPNCSHLGTTKEENLVFYWIHDRYSNTTHTIVYNLEHNEFEYQGLIIKGINA